MLGNCLLLRSASMLDGVKVTVGVVCLSVGVMAIYPHCLSGMLSTMAIALVVGCLVCCTSLRIAAP